MSYYTDMDEELGQWEQALEDCREHERLQREKAAANKRVIKAEVDRQLKNAGITKAKKKTRGKKVEVSCDVCRGKFEARVADRKRGWARCCGKSCSAIKRQRSKRLL